jgi:hypothetical protein
MAKDDKRQEAEQLYVRTAMTCPQIAAELRVSEGTVYRWKAASVAQGETADWEARRRAYNLSPGELKSVFSETLKVCFLKIRENPEMLSDPKVADSLYKQVIVLEKLDNRSNYPGAVLDLIGSANRWLAENQPELKVKMEPFWDNIFQELVKDTTKKGIIGAGN